MIGFRFNWRWLMALLGIAIVCGTIFYSQFLAKKIQREEQQKIEQWLAASKAVINPDSTLPNLIRMSSIPFLLLKQMRMTVLRIILTWIL